MGRLTRRGLAAALALAAAASCGKRGEEVQGEAGLRDIVRQMMPTVERATGLKFKRVPAVARRTREQVREYLIHTLDAELPQAELANIQAAYRHFGLLPDSFDLRRNMIDLLTEQVAGYYDPDSGTLFIPADVDSLKLRTIVIPHELVHALQDQYLPLDSVMHQQHQNDRRSAGEAIFEGQATLAQIRILMPEQPVDDLPSFLDQRGIIAQQQEQFPSFSNSPLWLRETLIFPYLGGADFVRWFDAAHPGKQPYGALMPTSTAQILHPERYAAHDRPVQLAFAHPGADGVRYEDDLGEFETRLLFEQLLGVGAEADLLASGWAGDRYAVLGPDAGALVWYSVWQDPAAAARFTGGLKRAWARRARPGFTARIDTLTLGGHPGVRLVDAPAAWRGWSRLPTVQIVSP
ncbi:MAG TPA: hypothetical protein VI160_00010 [Gemmatimonadales bacterium]